MATPVLITFDIEGRGDDSMRNGMLALGVCVGRADRVEVIATKRFCFAPLHFLDAESMEMLRFLKLSTTPFEMGYEKWKQVQVFEQQFDQKASEEFWDNHKGKLNAFIDAAKHPLEKIHEFADWIAQWDDKETYVATLASDNPSYDIAWIDYYLSRAGLSPLRRDRAGKYRSIIDTDSYARGVLGLPVTQPWVNDNDVIQKYDLDVSRMLFDHWPERDAEYIYRMHIGLVLAHSNRVAKILKGAAILQSTTGSQDERAAKLKDVMALQD